jgi:hypothetical protein
MARDYAPSHIDAIAGDDCGAMFAPLVGRSARPREETDAKERWWQVANQNVEIAKKTYEAYGAGGVETP